MWKPSGWELLIVLALVLLLFGPGRIGKIASELGQGIKNFRDGLGGKKDHPDRPEASKPDDDKNPNK
ncbi:MAG: twin-arginine translocase TatA/TatE family subunit [Chloroflexi bacterium]|nr:twin-arginine translocase TatA/TatE family subunit [Chloroflexota bacterium]